MMNLQKQVIKKNHEHNAKKKRGRQEPSTHTRVAGLSFTKRQNRNGNQSENFAQTRDDFPASVQIGEAMLNTEEK